MTNEIKDKDTLVLKRLDFRPKESLKAWEADDGFSYVEGYGAVFNFLDEGRDIIKPGAFTKTLQEGIPIGRIKFADSHNAFMSSDYVIGVVTEAHEDEYGLKFKAKLSETQRAQDVRTKIKEEILTALSIGYVTLKENAEDGINYLEEIKLYEISVVPWAMQELAVITDVKSDINTFYNEFKEGREISSANRRRLEAIVGLIQELLGSNVEEDDEKVIEEISKALDDDKDVSNLLNEFKKFQSTL